MRKRDIFVREGGRKAGEKEESENMVTGRGKITGGCIMTRCGERKTGRGGEVLQRGGVELATNNGGEE